jgi:uncharacterized protein
MSPFGKTQATLSNPKNNRPAALFLLCAAWIALSLPAGRELSGIAPALWQDFARESITAALLFAGFYMLARSWISELRPLSSVGFVRRPGIATEFGIGAALGWSIALAFVLPAVLTGNLSLTFGFNSIAIFRMVLSAATLVAFACVMQLVIAGLPTRLLVRATTPTWTTVAIVLVGICLALTQGSSNGGSFLFVALAAALFCTAFLRTRAIWLPLGLQIGWTVSLALLFGANSPYEPLGYGIIQSDTGGPAWLTGGPFGPEASTFAILVLILAIIVLVRITRDYAWHYTYQPIVGAGYSVEVAPPAEHIKEEQRAAKAVPLVQIQGLPPADPSDPIL